MPNPQDAKECRYAQPCCHSGRIFLLFKTVLVNKKILPE